jgi:hypothetical protein
LQYFKTNYVGEFDDSIKFIVGPKFGWKLWSVHERILLDVPITNNSEESSHRKINKRTNIAHPNKAKFLQIIKKEE